MKQETKGETPTFIDYLKGGHSGMSSVPDNDSVENETEPEMVDTSKTLLDIYRHCREERLPERRYLKW